MRKVIYLLLILLLLAACGQASAPEDESNAAEVPAVEAVPEPATSESDAGAETDLDSSAKDGSVTEDGPEDEETAVDAGFPMASSIEEAAERRETDWVKGAEDPLITIIEYGDFQ